jgi:hypothetical protein
MMADSADSIEFLGRVSGGKTSVEQLFLGA